MGTVYFDEISTFRFRREPCSRCGNARQRTEKFHQTINPYNRNVQGVPKSRAEIYDEITKEADAWYAAPFVCRGCAQRAGKGKSDE